MSNAVAEILLDKSNKRIQHKIGAESERLVCDASGKVLRYQPHLKTLLEELVQKKGWETSYQENSNILGLKRGSDYISLEPGAQLEISGAPQDHLFLVREKESEIEEEILSTQAAQDWSWLWLGLNPYDSVEDIQIIPSTRYQIMTRYYPAHSKRGLDMMRLTAGFHLNLDYYEPEEACEMLRAGLFLTPFVVALFCNSPFYHSQQAPSLSERTMIWKDNDSLRSGILDFVFHSDFQLMDYVNFVCSTPLMYFMDEQGHAQPAEGRCLTDLSLDLQKTNALPALREIFTEARIKPCCVELRSFDQQKPNERYAAMAFAIGLVYDLENRSYLNKEALRFSPDQLRKWIEDSARFAMKHDETYQMIQNLFQRSYEGLKRRGFGEEELLKPVEKLISQRKSPAELLLESKTFEDLK